MDNFSIHKWIRETHLNEDRGAIMASEFIKKMREKMRSLNDNELTTFRKYLATAFDMKLKDEEIEEENSKPQGPPKPPFHKITFTYIDPRGEFYGAYIYNTPESKKWDKKINNYQEAVKLLSKYEITPELPEYYDEINLQAIVDQLGNRDVLADFDDTMDVT